MKRAGVKKGKKDAKRKTETKAGQSTHQVPHVLVTGGGGYIGTVLTGLLLRRGYRVTVLDRWFFGDTIAHLRKNERLGVIREDVRNVTAKHFHGVAAVCDLAALPNDPAGQLDPEKTLAINFRGRAHVCRLAKAARVKRYVLASSSSIYGPQDGVVDETSTINPLTTYDRAHGRAEQAALKLAGARFTVTCLRLATAYGLSPRMRFDLAINDMTLSAFTRGAVRMPRDGTQWHPTVHVHDAARAFAGVIRADPALVNHEIFNVGSDDQNLQILPLARRVSEAVGVPFKEDWYGEPALQSARVSFAKIRDRLGYHPEHTPEDGARKIYLALQAGALTDGPTTHTLEWYKSLTQWHGVLKDIVLHDVIL